MAYRKENCFYRRCPEREHNDGGGPTCLYRAGLTWCHSPKYKDKWLIALYANRVAVMLHKQDDELTTSECLHCGKTWKGTMRAMRRVNSSMGRHRRTCKTRTPAQRRWNNHKAALEYARKKTASIVKITENPDHPGLQG